MMCHPFPLLLFLAFLSPLSAADDKAAREQIRQGVERIRAGAALAIEGRRISSEQVLPALYEQREFMPLWTRRESVNQLFDAPDNIHEDGLDPEDYHAEKLRQLRERMENARTIDARVAAEYDMLSTDSLIRLGCHLLVARSTW